VILLPSCKEKNDQFPPYIWSEYFYKTSTIAPRTVSAIFYENDHSIWLGAIGNEGLLHHDGYQWNVYDQADSGVEFDSVTALTRDGNGKLWAGCKKGLFLYDNTTWQKIPPFDGLNVTSVAVKGIGNIIAGIKGKSGGIAELKNNDWSFYTITNSDIPSGNINAIALDQDQIIWLATADKGIVRLKNNVWENMSSEFPVESDNFTCIETGPDGSIWTGSVASQIIHFEKDKFTVLNTGTSKPITSLLIADNGSLWCSTLGAGLVKFDGKNWTSFTMDNASLPSNDILSLEKGSPGYLFFSVPGGQVLMIKQ